MTSKFELSLINLLITLNGSKKMYRSAEAARYYLAKIGRQNQKKKYQMPAFCRGKWIEESIAGVRCMVKLGPEETTLLYLHGGAYFIHANAFSYQLLDKITVAFPAKVVIPIYSLAPHATFETAYAEIMGVYRSLIQANQNIVAIGDSAGGGLAVGLAYECARLGIKSPTQLVLISPFLDITCSSLEIPAIEPKDRMLCAAGLREIGSAWAGKTDPRDPRLSPLFGDVKTLPPVVIFTGTHDILYPEAKAFALRLEEAKQSVSLIVEEHHPHVYVILPMTAAKRAVATIIAKIQS
jgi:acetyl esterase/lipase